MTEKLSENAIEAVIFHWHVWSSRTLSCPYSSRATSYEDGLPQGGLAYVSIWVVKVSELGAIV